MKFLNYTQTDENLFKFSEERYTFLLLLYKNHHSEANSQGKRIKIFEIILPFWIASLRSQ